MGVYCTTKTEALDACREAYGLAGVGYTNPTTGVMAQCCAQGKVVGIVTWHISAPTHSSTYCDGENYSIGGQNWGWHFQSCISADADEDGHYTLGSCKTPNDDCNDNDPTIYPGAPELCDGIDNNCNGTVDEGCECINGQTEACYDGPAGTRGVGICHDGIKTCVNGHWGSCENDVLPQQELCDGKDNNCNGQTDEDTLKITSLGGSSAIIGPDAGGSVTISGGISNNSGKPITWTLSYPGGTTTGSGASASATWDGKIGGKFAPSGTYTVTLSVSTSDGMCSAIRTANIKVVHIEDCKLNIAFFSSANIASGNLSHNQDLFTVKGGALAASILLNYNSLSPYSGPLGIGWSHNYDISLTEYTDGSVLLREGNGGMKLYTKTDSGYTSQAGDYSVLTKNHDGTFVRSHKDGLKFNFDVNGKITSIVDRNGSAMIFSYSDGNLTAITDPAGRTTTLAYDVNNHISTIADPSSNSYAFTVSNGTLTSVVYPGGGQWSYTYDETAFMLTKTDPNGNATVYTYDSEYRVLTASDAEGAVKSISYPATLDATRTSTVTEKDGGVWQYTYDTQAGTLTSKTDPQGGITSYTHDDNRSMTSRTDPDGTTTIYTRDPSGNMVSMTDALGQTTSYAYNSFGQVTSITDPQGSTTTSSYDEKGNLTSTADATGATTSYEYDNQGHVTKVTNPAGQSTTYTYDQSGNLSSVTDPTGATTSFTYDAAGNITSQTDANGNTTRYEYDSNNRLIKVTDPAGNVTTFGYDKNGNRTSQNDANGNVTRYEYNAKGPLIKVIDALGNTTTYTYGGTGCSFCGGGGGDKLTSITDAKGNTTSYQYDFLGRLIKETDPLGNSITHAYDAKGILTSKTDANGNTLAYTYDGLGRLLTKTYPDNSTQSFTYDAKGNILTATNANISYAFSYDAGGRMTTVTDSNNRTVSHAYNILGNKKKTTYPDGSVVNYNYDATGRLASIVNGGGRTYSYEYDSLGRRTALAYPNGSKTTYGYDSSGRLTSLLTQNTGLRTLNSYSYTHDKIGNRLTKTEPDTKYAYGYDSIYRLLQSMPTKLQGTDKEQEHKAEAFSYDPVGNRLTGPESKDVYSYNRGNQLISDRNHQYEYDKNGNLIKKTEIDDDGATTAWTYSYDYENRLIKVIKQEDGETLTVTFKYDSFGRRIEKKVEETEDGEVETRFYAYVYDNEDIILEYLTKTEDGKAKTETTRYIHGPGIDEPLAIERNGEVYYYHADGLGSITALTDKKQKIVESYTYSSFGEMKRHGDKVKNAITFTGREWDAEIGLYFYRARYMDPKIGRFVSFDPILHPFNGPPRNSCNKNALPPSFNQALKAPLKLNPFVYTDNNPINFADPRGLFSHACFMVGLNAFTSCLVDINQTIAYSGAPEILFAACIWAGPGCGPALLIVGEVVETVIVVSCALHGKSKYDQCCEGSI